MNEQKVKVRLRKPHYHNAVKKRPGSVLPLDPKTAAWLIENKIAEPLKFPANSGPK